VLVPAAPGISASPSEENMRYFNVMVLGPAQSPYEGSKTSSQFVMFFFC
jgi:ubiquitin-conjugating enzyme E2 N